MRQAFERDTFLRGASLGAVTAVLAFLIYGLVFGGEGLGRFLLAALLAGAITNGVSVMLERRRRQRPTPATTPAPTAIRRPAFAVVRAPAGGANRQSR